MRKIILLLLLPVWVYAVGHNTNALKVKHNKTIPLESVSLGSVMVDEGINCNNTSACQIVRDTSQSVLNAINQNATNQSTINIINTIVTPIFDFNLMTKYALGSNWKVANSTQQKHLVTLFQQLLILTYAGTLTKFRGSAVEIIKSSNTVQLAQVLINFTLNVNNPQPIKVEYDLAYINSVKTWKVYDIKIENTSLITSYRQQFNELISNGSIQGLIEQLQSKISNLQSQNSPNS